MKVSVLVTFYNQEDYVDEALQSVFEQKCDFDFEVLIGCLLYTSPSPRD